MGFFLNNEEGYLSFDNGLRFLAFFRRCAVIGDRLSLPVAFGCLAMGLTKFV
jgi:hypothetical protein